jgi:hypothetical protein
MALQMSRKVKFTLFALYAAAATLALIAGLKREIATTEEIEFVADQTPSKGADSFE